MEISKKKFTWSQPEGFDLAKGKDFVCKLKKALYGLKQAPRAWFAKLDHYLQQEGFKKGVVGRNLYMKMDKEKLLITLVYVDDLIFARNDEEMSHEFALNMSKKFEMSMIGELSYFLGLQISQTSTGMFISQAKYLKDMLKRYGMEDCAPMSTPMTTDCKLSKDDDTPHRCNSLQINNWSSPILNYYKTRYYASSGNGSKISVKS